MSAPVYPYGEPYGDFKIAGDVEPARGTNDALFDYDKSIFFLLDFFRYLIRRYPGPLFLQIASAWSIKQPGGGVLSDAVRQIYPTDPGPYLHENQFEFPLLCAYRTESKYKQKTAGWEEDYCDYEVLYTLPPLDVAQARNAIPYLVGVEKTLRRKLTQSFDPGYAPPGGSLGQSPWDPPFAHIDRISLDRGRFGYLEGVGNLFFPCLRMFGSIWERDDFLRTGAGPLSGMDIHGNLVAGDGTEIAPFVRGSTQEAPTITSISPASGPHTGGTSVTITGTLFMQGPDFGPNQLNVLFGGAPAQSVEWVSATEVIAVTPVAQGAGSVGVLLVNPDSQVARSPVSFSFT